MKLESKVDDHPTPAPVRTYKTTANVSPFDTCTVRDISPLFASETERSSAVTTLLKVDGDITPDTNIVTTTASIISESAIPASNCFMTNIPPELFPV
jgi:hypothetical protein